MNSFIKRQIYKLDEKLKKFFGLSNASETLDSSLIINNDGEISIIINETYKRSYNKYNIDSFMQNQFHTLNNDLKEKFGRVLGEIIATDLVLSFNENNDKSGANCKSIERK